MTMMFNDVTRDGGDFRYLPLLGNFPLAKSQMTGESICAYGTYDFGTSIERSDIYVKGSRKYVQ